MYEFNSCSHLHASDLAACAGSKSTLFFFYKRDEATYDVNFRNNCRIGKCQNWKMSESNFCSFWKKLESVRIGWHPFVTLAFESLVNVGNPVTRRPITTLKLVGLCGCGLF